MTPKWMIYLLALLVAMPTSTVLAQDDDGMDEGMEEFMDEEIIDEEMEELAEEEEPQVVKPNKPPRGASRFRRASKGNNKFPTKSRFNRSNRTSSQPTNFGKTSSSPTKISNPTIKKVDNGIKSGISFADAQPEDINNKNFPDIVESFDYKDAPLPDVVNAMARLTGKNFIIEPGLNGKITIIAPRKITVAEAWEAFLSALAINDFTIVPMGKFLKIRKIDKAKTDSIETYAGAYFPSGDQLITRILRLKYINASDFQKTFERVIKSKSGQLVAYDKTNSLIITDLGSNVERISRIIAELDKPGFEEQLSVIPIRNAKAKDLADLIEKIINKGETKGKSRRFRSNSRFNKNNSKNESLSLVSPDERTNSIIVVGNSEGINRIKKLVAQLDYPLDASESGTVHVYYVRHGDAKKIEETITGIAQETEKKATQSSSGKGGKSSTFKPPTAKKQMFGGDVVLKADENTNSLIISASPQDYKVVLELLNKIDIPKDQVYVQAYIVEMRAEKGDDWEAGVVKFLGAEPPNSGQQGDGGLARAGYTFGGLASLSNIANPGTLFTFGNDDIVNVRIGDQDLQIPSLLGFINILKSRTNANVLSTPQIMAMDNEESVIEVGEEVPVGLGQVQNAAGGALTSQPQFRDATIMLKIKPFISPDSDIVRMEVEQQVNDVSTREIQAEQLAQNSIAITKRNVKTNLTLKSGETAVLGGLMQDSDSIVERKIPLLGDIPVLGWLFKQRSVNRIKSNLLVFLTPSIVRNSSDAKKITRKKVNERIDWVKKNARGRDPFGEDLAELVRYADARDEFDLEDQELFNSNPAPVLDEPVDEQEMDDIEDELEDDIF